MPANWVLNPCLHKKNPLAAPPRKIVAGGRPVATVRPFLELVAVARGPGYSVTL
jgi:hypothetical protein